MKLTFIFKYTWIGMIILAYIIWSIKSIKDIIRTWKETFDPCFLDDSTLVWIGIALLAIFAASFMYWLFGGVRE